MVLKVKGQGQLCRFVFDLWNELYRVKLLQKLTGRFQVVDNCFVQKIRKERQGQRQGQGQTPPKTNDFYRSHRNACILTKLHQLLVGSFPVFLHGPPDTHTKKQYPLSQHGRCTDNEHRSACSFIWTHFPESVHEPDPNQSSPFVLFRFHMTVDHFLLCFHNPSLIITAKCLHGL